LAPEGNIKQEAKPKKQGKSYRLDLGQNSGPFKKKDIYGQPLVDMFSPQGFAEQQVDSKTGETMLKKTQSPRIGILGSLTFAPSGKNRRMEEQPSNTVNQHMKRIDE